MIGTGLYDVILADPPWQFKTFGPGGMSRSADNHYPTMDTDAICALSVPAAKDCVLFMWATAPMLEHALRVISAWGFAYKSHAMWDKRVQGTGYYFRNVHEPILLATKGKPKAPLPENRPESLISERKGRHSAKPETSYRMIETMYPDARRLEMFARIRRRGWDAWGNEIEEAA